MKKYFAKYLSVEEKIKEGDRWWYKDFKMTPLIMDKQKITEQSNRKKQKVELFLCSRDIQVGDRVQNGDGVECKIPNQIDLITAKENEYFKVIGEISPEAVWVKEGDEFDEDEVRFYLKDEATKTPISSTAHSSVNGQFKSLRGTVWEGYERIAKIKCSQCNHFH